VRKSDVLRFDGGGLFSSDGPWIHSQRVIESYELILVTRGTVHLQEGGREHTLTPNDYILLHPHIPHGGTKISTEAVEFYWLHFYAPPAEWLPRLRTPCTGMMTAPGALIQTTRQLLQIWDSPAYPTDTADHLLYVLLAEFLVQREQQAPQNALAARIHEYVRSHADRPLTAVQVAEKLGYHPDHLSRVLKSCYGLTLQQEIVRQRLERAKVLLQSTDCTVAEVAAKLGYDDPNLFEKFFRYHAKTAPTAYRNSFSRMHTNHE